jgi:hypothetical protein
MSETRMLNKQVPAKSTKRPADRTRRLSAYVKAEAKWNALNGKR